MSFEIKCVEGTKARCTVLTDNCKGGYFLLKQFFLRKMNNKDYDKYARSLTCETKRTSWEINKWSDVHK